METLNKRGGTIMPLQERKERNKQINAGFSEMYNQMKQEYGTASFQRIYFALGKRFNLSEMQIRRIIRNY